MVSLPANQNISKFDQIEHHYNSTNKSQNLKNIIYSGSLFNNVADGDLSLISNSPCINAGLKDTSGLFLSSTDITGLTNRIIGESIDIGAYEYPSIIGIKNGRINTERYDFNQNSPAELTIYTVSGKTIYFLPKITASLSSINALIPGSLSSGIFFVRIKTTKGTPILHRITRF